MNLLPINLPQDSKALVKVGEKVKRSQVIAIATSQNDTIIHLSSFNFKEDEFERSLKKHLGDAISEGEVVAVKKKLLGGKKIYSPFSGTLIKIDKNNQDLYLKPKSFNESIDVLSPVEGVVDFCDNSKILIKTDAQTLSALEFLGKNAKGELIKVNIPKELDSRVSGKVLMEESLGRLAVYKAFGLGAVATIAKEYTDFDFVEAGDNFDKTVVTVSSEDFTKIEKLIGKSIVLDKTFKLIFYEKN